MKEVESLYGTERSAERSPLKTLYFGMFWIIRYFCGPDIGTCYFWYVDCKVI